MRHQVQGNPILARFQAASGTFPAVNHFSYFLPTWYSLDSFQAAKVLSYMLVWKFLEQTPLVYTKKRKVHNSIYVVIFLDFTYIFTTFFSGLFGGEILVSYAPYW